jgi:hypothetical protein
VPKACVRDDGLKLVLKLRRDEKKREIGDRPFERRERRTECVLGRGETRTARRDPSADA